jgi:nicotinamide mononucleotide transporter
MRAAETHGAHLQASSTGLAVHRLGGRNTLAALAFTGLLTLVGYELLVASGSAQPWLEAATTAGGLVATWLATRKLLDNWSWWLVINIATAWLYWQAALRPTAGLYLAYAALAVLGWREWRKQLA